MSLGRGVRQCCKPQGFGHFCTGADLRADVALMGGADGYSLKRHVKVMLRGHRYQTNVIHSNHGNQEERRYHTAFTDLHVSRNNAL